MATNAPAEAPVVGTWYRDPLRRRFEVVSLDMEAGVIQVCYEDGEDGALTLADWRHVMVDRDAMLDEELTSPLDEDER